MTNFNVQITGTGNTSQATKSFEMLRAEVERLNAALVQTGFAAQGVDPKGFAKMQGMIQKNSQIYRDAANSTGMWEASQIRLTSAVDNYTNALERQKMSWKDMRKQASIGSAAYQEQLRLQKMLVVNKLPGVTPSGREIYDVAKLRGTVKELDTIGNRIGWIREQTRSAATQMINWGKNTQWTGRQLMVGFTMPLAAFGAAAGVMAYQVDKELTRIQKVYDTVADANSKNAQEQMRVEQELMDLRKASIETATMAAREYASSATDTLQIQAELAATGIRGQKLQESTNQIMRISTLGEMEHADALNASIALQSVFNMSVKETANAFNYMNAIENATSLQLKDFATAIPIAAAPIKAFGGDVYELGILLTAMRENGIQAAEGANALKASMQRLGRPSKQIQEEFQALTGESIVELVDGSENLTEVFMRLNEVTRGLSEQDQRKVFAGLFGSYQVTRMMALVQGMENLENGAGQVSEAMRVAGQDASQWASAADREIGKLQESVSFKFKAALETLKIELQNFGGPFLDVASMIISFIAKVLKAANSLPKPIKLVGAFVLGLLALAGPLIMLSGLAVNFAGNALKMGVAITGVLTKFELLNKESAVAKAASALVSQGFMSEASAATQAAQALWGLYQARAAANQSIGVGNAPVAGGMTTTASGLIIPNSAMPDFDANGNKLPSDNGSKLKNNMAAVAGFTAAAATAGMLLSTSSSETANNFGQIAFTAAMLAPAIGGAAQGITFIRKVFTGTTKSADQLAKASREYVPIWKRVGTAVKGTATGMSRFTLGLGAAGIAVGVVAAGLWMWKKHIDAARAEEKKFARDMHEINESVLRQLDVRIKKQKELNLVTALGQSGGGTSTQELARLFEEGPDKKILDAFKSAPEIDQSRIAAEHYMRVLDGIGGTAVKAEKYVAALFYAANGNLLEAEMMANKLRSTLGVVSDAGMLKTVFSEALSVAGQDSEFAAAEHGEAIGRIFADKLARAALNDGSREEVVAAMGQSLEQQFDLVFSRISNESRELLKNAGINTTGELGRLMNQMKEDYTKVSEIFDIPADKVQNLMYNLADTGLSQQLMNVANTEKAIVAELTRSLGITQDIVSLEQLRATWQFQAMTASKEQAEELFKQRMIVYDIVNGLAVAATFGLVGDKSRQDVEDSKLLALNQQRIARGLKQTGTLTDYFGRRTTDVNGFLVTQKAKVDGVNASLARTNALMSSITGHDIASTVQQAMSDFQQGIADATMDSFNKNMDASLAATEAAGERRLDGFEARAERRQNGLENMQERRRKRIEASYDRRIEKVNDAIEAEQKAEEIRQKIFDAEMTRIDRLNEVANRNIDFNVALNEGNLDEAAKIRNDMQAATEKWNLEDESEAGSSRADRRIAKLEKRLEFIEKQKDKRLEALSKIEEAERAAQQRSIERERAALQASVDATNAAEQAKWESRKKYMEESLEDFTRYIAKDEKDMLAHIKRWEKEHKGLSLTTEGQFEVTADNINAYIKTSVTEAMRALVNQRDWEQNGRTIAAKLIRGAFDMDMSQFKRWMVTGIYPKGGSPKTTTPNSGGGYDPSTRNTGQGGETRHEGGLIGSGGGSRKGVARTSGMHPSEVNVLAKRGEYMVNDRAAAKHLPLLDAINSNRIDRGKKPHGKLPSGGSGGANLGLAGLFSGMLAAGIRGAIRSAAIEQGANAWKKQQAAEKYSAGLATARAGMYGDRYFNAEQLRNASIISSVGKKMGMSARDLQIGIMTAITESGLINVNYGDRDSLGLFQQRPSMGWGTAAQVTNPVYASGKFFSSLKGVIERAQMSPWMAAQTVQRSAYSDGSNYRQYWDEAQAIYNAMAKAGASSRYPQGPGGWHRPAPGGFGWFGGYSTHDYNTPMGTPLYAVSDGDIVESRDIRSGGGPDIGTPSGYTSYGVTVAMRTASGDIFRYAHMTPGTRIGLGPVKGGTIVGRSGSTGNSSGPHVHFDVNGNYNARSWLASHGIGLEKGAQRIKWDNTIANLHKGEAVLTEDLNRKFHQGVENFANGPSSEYNLYMSINGSSVSVDELVNKTMNALKKMERRRPGRN